MSFPVTQKHPEVLALQGEVWRAELEKEGKKIQEELDNDILQ